MSAYIADLEVELAYEQRENERLRDELDEALDIVHELCVDAQHRQSSPVVVSRFTIPNPGLPC